METLRQAKEAVKDKFSNVWRDTGKQNIQKEDVKGNMKSIVGKKEKKARKPWFTQEMLKKKEERGKWKNIYTV